MNFHFVYSFLAVVVLGFVAFLGGHVSAGRYLFGIIIPYAALLTFVLVLAYRVADWAKSAVPFRIPTTCGQQKSLDWIQHAKIENPASKPWVFVRMAFEVLTFRSLFRNTKAKMIDGKLAYFWEIWLWVFALAFHYAFLVVVLRHLRFFTEPVLAPIRLLETVDSFFRIEFFSPWLKVGLPGFFLSGLVLFAAVLFLLLRRVILRQVRYISLGSDFFPLLLILGIAFTGILMRYFTKVDIVGVKSITMGLVTFNWSLPETVSGIFYAHLFLVSILLAYFPFSKLMHMAGVFLSPTRNLTANTREVRHVNPWNYPVEVHTYDEYEEEFREKMIEAGLPVEKE